MDYSIAYKSLPNTCTITHTLSVAVALTHFCTSHGIAPINLSTPINIGVTYSQFTRSLYDISCCSFVYICLHHYLQYLWFAHAPRKSIRNPLRTRFAKHQISLCPHNQAPYYYLQIFLFEIISWGPIM